MRTSALKVVPIISAALLLSVTVCTAEDVKANANPHSETGDCSICHVAPANKLRGWFTSGSTKRELKRDLNQICLDCHTIEPAHAGGFMGVGKGHATGLKTALNHQNLPLAKDGTITCATTCHDMHVAPDDRQLHVKHLRLPVNSLCVSCHDR